MMKKLNYSLRIISILIGLYRLITYGAPSISDTLMYLGIIPITFLPVIINKFFKVKIPAKLETIYLIFIILAYDLGSINRLYSKIYWFDTFNHFISGIISGIVAIWTLKNLKKYQSKDKIFNIIYIIAFTMMIASFWELIEFSIDNILNLDVQKVKTTGVNDTMKDIFCALLGGITFIISTKFIKIKEFIKNI